LFSRFCPVGDADGSRDQNQSEAEQSGLVRMASPFAFIKMSQKRFARHAS